MTSARLRRGQQGAALVLATAPPLQQRRLQLLRVHLQDSKNPQRNQYPTARLGQLVTLVDLQQRYPTVRLGQAMLSEHLANLDRPWRRRAPQQLAQRTGVALTSSRYSVDSARPTRPASAAYSENSIFGGAMLVPPQCSGR